MNDIITRKILLSMYINCVLFGRSEQNNEMSELLIPYTAVSKRIA